MTPDHRQDTAQPLRLELIGIQKRFGGVAALRGAGISIRAGEVHGLLGENGSGKSTLIKVLAGFHQPDAGELRVDGVMEALPLSAERLDALGISFVHQDLGLIDSLSVTENLLLRDIASRRGAFMSIRRSHRQATSLLERYGLAIAGSIPLAELSGFEKAMVAIARALEGIAPARAEHRGLLVLDEAMAFLADHERAQLSAIVRALAAEGTAVMLVSHDLDDALGICDRITVLRDGAVVATVDVAETTRSELAELILGRTMQAAEKVVAPRTESASVRVRSLRSTNIRNFDVDLSFGEIIGLTGLVGESYAEVLYGLYGALEGASGTLEFAERTYPLSTMDPPTALVGGIALVPGDRQRQGGVASLKVGENVAIPRLHDYFRRGLLRHKPLNTEIRGQLRRFDVRPDDPATDMGSLSGGNQQKAIIAKWLQLRPRLLLLDEPTIGVDVGSRVEIFQQIRELARSGAAVICASSDYAQLAELCDRVLIMVSGSVRLELAGAELTREEILAQCLLLGDARQETQIMPGGSSVG